MFFFARSTHGHTQDMQRKCVSSLRWKGKVGLSRSFVRKQAAELLSTAFHEHQRCEPCYLMDAGTLEVLAVRHGQLAHLAACVLAGSWLGGSLHTGKTRAGHWNPWPRAKLYWIRSSVFVSNPLVQWLEFTSSKSMYTWVQSKNPRGVFERYPHPYDSTDTWNV